MSTNYYAFDPFPGGEAADPSGNAREGLHIGQSAVGWRFQFRAHPALGLTTYQAWHDFLRRPGVTIRNEYGYPTSPDEMDETMLRRTEGDRPLRPRVHESNLRAGYHLDGPHAFYSGEFF